MSAGASKSLTQVATAVLACFLSFVLMLITQSPALAFFYDLFPGRKSADGPVLVFVGYLVCTPATLVVLWWLRRRASDSETVTGFRAYPVIVSALTGPSLMALLAAVNAWLARVPSR